MFIPKEHGMPCTKLLARLSNEGLTSWLHIPTRFFIYISNTFISNASWNWQKIKQMLSNTLRLNFCHLKIVHIFHQLDNPKAIGHKQGNKCVCIHKIIRLIMMNMKMKIKKRSLRYDINKRKPRYSKCMHIKQHLSNIWSSIHGKVKKHWDWVDKECCL